MLGSPSPSEGQIRSGQSRHQSPPGQPRSPFGLPQGGASAPSLSQTANSIQSPQPRVPNGHYANGAQDWQPERPPPIGQAPSRPGSRPLSYTPSRDSGDAVHPFSPNGHVPTAAAVRQRI